ncbi:MAG: response regulator [Phycisphaerales bacterium]|nr:response regulator [Phycisphaerales bacterium]
MIGDTIRLRQVIVNLLANAIKFTSKGQVLLRAVTDSCDDKSVTIRCSITDTGIGIPPDRIPRLFRSFSQVDRSTTRKYGGSGLGLAICKRLVEALGGEIGLESVPGQGSTFWFTATLVRAAGPPAQLLAPPDLRGLNLLVAGGSDASRQILREQLVSWGMQVCFFDASDGEESHPWKTGTEFDAAILDIPVDEGDHEQNTPAIVRASALAPRLVVLLPVERELPSEVLADPSRVQVLRKPPSSSELLDALVRALCDSPGATVAPPDEHQQADALPAPAAGVKGTVLLAEDMPTNQLYVTELLRRHGYACDVAGDGVEALAALERRRYDLLLLDCQMPELDGFGVVRALRESERTGQREGHLTVVALTANAIQGDRDRCLAAGMDDYLSKPLEPRTLLQALERHIPVRGASEVLQEPRHTDPEPERLVFDPDAALARCDGDTRMLASTIESFGTHAPGYLHNLRTALRAGDAASAAGAAHAIKGAAGMMTAERTRTAAASIEAAARNGDLRSASDELDELRVELERAMDQMHQTTPPVARQAEEHTSV